MGENKWTVVSQQHTIGKLPDDTFGDVVRVTFRLPSGTVGRVNVPAHLYTLDNVRAAVDAAADAMTAVENL